MILCGHLIPPLSNIYITKLAHKNFLELVFSFSPIYGTKLHYHFTSVLPSQVTQILVILPQETFLVCQLGLFFGMIIEVYLGLKFSIFLLCNTLVHICSEHRFEYPQFSICQQFEKLSKY